MRLFGVLAIAVLLLTVLAGAVLAAPAGSDRLDRAAAVPADTGIAATLAQTDTAPSDPPAQQPENGDPPVTTNETTNNFFVSIPWWGWLLIVLLIVLILGIIIGSNRGGGGTTVIKD